MNKKGNIIMDHIIEIILMLVAVVILLLHIFGQKPYNLAQGGVDMIQQTQTIARHKNPLWK